MGEILDERSFVSGERPSRARQTLALNLRAFRAARGMSQEDLAARAGIHRNYLGGVERRERNIALDNLEKLAAAMGMDVSELLAERIIGSCEDEGADRARTIAKASGKSS